MAATVQIRRLTGNNSSITSTDITSGSLHAGTDDTNTSPCTIQVPSSGSNYSFWVTTQLNCTVAADNSLTNVKWYTDGTNSLGTGVDAEVTTASGYTSAIGTAASSGVVLSTTCYPNLAGLDNDGATSPFFLFTSSCKLAVSGSIAATTGSFAERVVFQIQVESTAGAGNTAEETITWEFDES